MLGLDDGRASISASRLDLPRVALPTIDTLSRNRCTSPRNLKRKGGGLPQHSEGLRRENDMLVIHVAGARPNFMKLAPVMSALAAEGGEQSLVHTGQHYDGQMSDIFFNQLGLPLPDVNLGVGSASHAVQTAEVMLRFEPILKQRRPDLVLVYGDVNSTVAAALVARKMGIPVGHVEAGLRSFDRSMPEEINRVLTDRLSDLLFAPSPDGDLNLAKEGVPSDSVHRVGNTMIDTLIRLLPKAKESGIIKSLGVEPQNYVLVTLHRPSNVDSQESLARIFAALSHIARQVPVVFPLHPRTRERIRAFGVEVSPAVQLYSPLGYLEFIALQKEALAVVTDSGGIQEETTFLGVPCFTLRDNTERPITLTQGTNRLVPEDELGSLPELVSRVSPGRSGREHDPPALWDGKSGWRIASVIVEWHCMKKA